MRHKRGINEEICSLNLLFTMCTGIIALTGCQEREPRFVSQWAYFEEGDSRSYSFVYLCGYNSGYPMKVDQKADEGTTSPLYNSFYLEHGHRMINVVFSEHGKFNVEYSENQSPNWELAATKEKDDPSFELPHVQFMRDNNLHRWSYLGEENEFHYSFGFLDKRNSANINDWIQVSYGYLLQSGELIPYTYENGVRVVHEKGSPDWIAASDSLSIEAREKALRIFDILAKFEWSLTPGDILGESFMQEYNTRKDEFQAYEVNSERAEGIYRKCSSKVRPLLDQIERAYPALSPLDIQSLGIR